MSETVSENVVTASIPRGALRAGAQCVGAQLGRVFAGPVGFRLGAIAGDAMWRYLQREADLRAIEHAMVAQRRLSRSDRPTVGDYAEARSAARDLAVRALAMADTAEVHCAR